MDDSSHRILDFAISMLEWALDAEGPASEREWLERLGRTLSGLQKAWQGHLQLTVPLIQAHGSDSAQLFFSDEARKLDQLHEEHTILASEILGLEQKVKATIESLGDERFGVHSPITEIRKEAERLRSGVREHLERETMLLSAGASNARIGSVDA